MSAPSVATEGHVPDTTTSTTSPTTSTAPEAAHRRRHVQLNEGQTARYGVPVPLVAGVERPVGPKLKGWDFYRAIGSPKFIAAPMVDQSEYAWRILSRKYGADLCYTPMWHARLFSNPEHNTYRNEMWQVGESDDRPLFVQFCANDTEDLLAAARIVEPFCDAVDLNLGCPQGIAKKGHYGAFLMEDWKLIESLIRKLDQGLERVPVTAKIRVFETVEKTVAYAKMVEAAGASIVVVHGRLREQKGHNTGLADWNKIRAVKEALSVPVFANGNILYPEDIDRCFKETGVDAVMAAETNLYNPGIFNGTYPPVWQVAQELLDIYGTVPNSSHLAYVKAHLFKVFQPCFADHPDLRTKLATCRTEEDYQNLVSAMTERMKQAALSDQEFSFPFVPTGEKDQDGYLKLPKWVCQPYLRPDTIAAIKGIVGPNEAGRLKHADQVRQGEQATESSSASKRERTNSDGAVAEEGAPTSPKMEQPKKKAKVGRKHNNCSNCPNVKSPNCTLGACKGCCHSICAKAFEAWPTDLIAPPKGPERKAEPAPSEQPKPAEEAKDEWEVVVLCEGHKRKAKVRRGKFGGIENGKAILLST